MQLNPFQLALAALLSLLPFIDASNIDTTPSAFLFQGNGHQASVVDATGCKITYVLRCTDFGACTMGSYSTVTQNGESSYTMIYTTISTSSGSSAASSGDITGVGSEACKLFGTTVAYCTDSVAVNVGTITISSTSSFDVSETAQLGYAQVPITAGPASASASVLSCSISGNTVTPDPSFPTSTTHTGSSPANGGTTGPTGPTGTGSGSSTPMPSSGLSTGAKIGIGVGAGVLVLALFGLGGLFLIRRHIAKKAKKAAALPPPIVGEKPDAMTPDDEVGRVHELYYQAPKYEMPGGREPRELDSNAASEPWKGGWNPRYELP